MKKLLFLLLLSLCSCSTIGEVLGLAKNVNVTWNPNEGNKTIDSTKIVFKPCYWVETIDSTNQYEKEFYLEGYKIWILQTGCVRRIEVLKQDTVIKIFGK